MAKAKANDVEEAEVSEETAAPTTEETAEIATDAPEAAPIEPVQGRRDGNGALII